MPRYFFHVVLGRDRVEDKRGVELPYAEAGTRIAQFRAASRMMKVAHDIVKRHRLGMGPDENPGRIEVTNEDGHVVASIEFPPRGRTKI